MRGEFAGRHVSWGPPAAAETVEGVDRGALIVNGQKHL
jgi:hypothetical protein